MSAPDGATMGRRMLTVLVDELAVEDGLFLVLEVGAVVELDLTFIKTPPPVGRVIRGRLEVHPDDPGDELLIGDGWTAGLDGAPARQGSVELVGEMRSLLFPLGPPPGRVSGRVIRIDVVTERRRRHRKSGHVERESARRELRAVQRAPYAFAMTTVEQEAGPDGYEQVAVELGVQVVLDLDDVPARMRQVDFDAECDEADRY